MNYLFELSKEHKTLPRAEVLACLETKRIDYNISESNDDVLIIESNSPSVIVKSLSKRLSYTFFIDELLFSCFPIVEKIKKKSYENNLKTEGSIAIKYKNRSKNIDSRKIVKTLAGFYTRNREVTLDNPDIEIRGIITDSTVYVGLKIVEINRSQFEKRKVQNRPFFSPISLHPKLACALINMSLIKEDDTLLDPFCGTGGILIEAGLIGIQVIGSDIQNKMIEGCKKNLDFYNIKNYKLYQSDIGEISKHIKKVDAIVTDLPYGKSTTTKGEKMDQLYERAFKTMSKLLREGGRAIIGLPNREFISLGKKYFSLIEKHDFRVHKSLVRYFVVYEK